MNINKSQFKYVLKDPELQEVINLPTVWYHDSLSRKWNRFKGLFTTVIWQKLYVYSRYESKLRILPKRWEFNGKTYKNMGWKSKLPNIHWWILHHTYFKYISSLEKRWRKAADTIPNGIGIVHNKKSDKLLGLWKFLYSRFEYYSDHCGQCGFEEYNESVKEAYTECTRSISYAGEFGTHCEWDTYWNCPRCNYKNFETDGAP